MKKCVLALALWMGGNCAEAATNSLGFYNTAAISNAAQTAALTASTDWHTGSFLQLIYCGPNGVIDAFTNSNPQGVSSDDTVVMTGFLGQDDIFGAVNGFYNEHFFGRAVVDQSYFVRVFDGGSPDIGIVATNALASYPNGETNHYWESFAHVDASDITGYDNWDFATTGGVASHSVAVPEPLTLGFGGLALGLLYVFRRARRAGRQP